MRDPSFRRRGTALLRAVGCSALALLCACPRTDGTNGGSAKSAPRGTTEARPDLLLVTLDATRADAVSPEAPGVTPRLGALAARGVRFTNAYATVPTTLPSHLSMLSGLYPAGHGVHENGRRVGADVPLVAARLGELGYATAAFVSGYPLARRSGVDRGFSTFDDDFGEGRLERDAESTTERALAWLAASASNGGRRAPRFLWVHYYDAHEPYAPPEPFRARFAADPYRGEIAAVDASFGRLLEAFEGGAGAAGARVVVAGDHGEGRGEHGEAFHGNLLYQGVMRVPLVVFAGPGAATVRDDAVSVRQIHDTLLAWAGDPGPASLLAPPPAEGAPVLGEAMQPYLAWRWQPQTMAVDGRWKLIRSGRLELYDLAADPGETHDLAGSIAPERTLAQAVAGYPLPSPAAASAPPPATEEARRKLASLGYVSGFGAPATIPADAPRAADRTTLFPLLDDASRAFAAGRYRESAALFERVVSADRGNLMAMVELAVSRSFLGERAAADAGFAAAKAIDPTSLEVRFYEAMHLAATGRGAAAAPLFEEVLAAQPDRAGALEGLARIRAVGGRFAEAAALFERSLPVAEDPARTLAELGLARMAMADTAGALDAFERARSLAPARFENDIELGVLFLASRRLDEARDALDRVPATGSGRAMALFKRAQVSVLLGEPDAGARVRAAAEAADATTAPLIRSERLFAPFLGN